jgi:serine/threonine-protein phosphatase 2B catalytic subunit
MESFDSMPLACLINDKYLAVHGGISPELKKLDMIQKIK